MSDKELSRYLREDARVPEQRIVHYIRWIKKYVWFTRRTDSEDAEVDSYIDYLKPRYADWMVLQARHAVLLYVRAEKSSGKAASVGINEGVPANGADQKDRLLLQNAWKDAEEQLRSQIRLRNLSYQTEKAYMSWFSRFNRFLGQRYTKDISEKDLEKFLTWLVVKRNVSKSTQRVAFNALLLFFRSVIEVPVIDPTNVIRSPKNRKLPVVLSSDEIQRIFSYLQGEVLVAAKIIYGSGLRLTECLSLRIKDIGFSDNTITVRSGKGDKDRITILPETLKKALIERCRNLRKIHDEDRSAGIPGVSRRYHLYPTTIQKAFHTAVLRADIAKSASVHGLRHSFATRLIEAGYDIRTIQTLLGHSNVQTTMIYTHVARSHVLGVISPIDRESA